MKFSTKALVFTGIMAIVLAFTSCKNKCEEEICLPCPSSRFVVEYQDSLGNCVPAFHSSAMVHAISKSNPADTAYSYNFGDSCKVGFIIDDEMSYHLVGSNPATNDVFEFLNITYQDPVEVTECCLCYPAASVSVSINGDTSTVNFPVGEYENTSHVIILN